MHLQNKVAVITGASAGIGEAVARNLSAAGANLILTARRGDKLDRLAASLPGQSATLAADISAPGTAPALLALAREKFGRADILINNAGLLEMATVDDADIEKLVQVIRVNLEALVRTSYVFAPVFKAQMSGAIINISSIGAFHTTPTMGVYSGTKAAVELLSSSLRIELGPSGVKVGSIAPGSTRTEMLDEIRSKGSISTETPASEPDDIAAAIRFMLEQPASTTVAGMRIFGVADG